MKEKNFRDPNTWKVNWYHWHRWYGGWKRSPTAQGSTTLRVPKPLLRQTGEWYEVEVRNQFGFAKGVSKIIVIEGKLSFVLRPIHTRDFAPGTCSRGTLLEQSSSVCTNNFMAILHPRE